MNNVTPLAGREKPVPTADVKALLKGHTEAEVVSAAQKARELMDQHRRSMTDELIRKEPVERQEFARKTRVGPAAADYCGTGIEQLAGVKWWLGEPVKDATGKPVKKAVLFGLRADVVMAQALYEMIRAAIQERSDAYKKTKTRNGRAAESIWSYKVAMSERINRQLLDMAKKLEGTAKTASGTALAALKTAIVEEAYGKLSPARQAPGPKTARQPETKTKPAPAKPAAKPAAAKPNSAATKPKPAAAKPKDAAPAEVLPKDRALVVVPATGK